MSYVIYNVNDTRIFKNKRTGKESYATLAAAKSAVTRNRLDEKTYAIAESKHFHDNIEKMVERVNIMSGKKFKEPINTPYYCSPSSETYWSM